MKWTLRKLNWLCRDLKNLLHNEKGCIFATVNQTVKTYFIMKHDNNQQNHDIVASIYSMYYNDLKLYLLSYTHSCAR